MNLIFVFVLLCARFAPGRYETWRNWRRSVDSRAKAGDVETRLGDADATNYEARLRRDAEWRERAKKRLPWH